MKIKKLFSVALLTILLFASSSTYSKALNLHQKMFFQSIKMQIFKSRKIRTFEQFKKIMATEIKNTITRKNNLGLSLTSQEETKLLFLAIMSNNIKLLKKLIEQGADVSYKLKNSGGETTPLILLATSSTVFEFDPTQMTELLLKHEASPTIKDKSGANAIMAAKELCQDKMIELFKKYGY